MERLKMIVKKLLFLPPLPTVLIAIPSFAFVCIILATEKHSAFSYVAYVLSAYALIITITGFIGIMQAVKKGANSLPVVQMIRKNPLGKRLFQDDVFRCNIALHGGLFVNLLYVALNLFSGVRYRSAWFVALAFYYFLLATMRVSLVQYVHQKPTGEDIPAELRKYRICGVLLLFMNQALMGIVIYIVHQNAGFHYRGSLIYAMAAYTFYITIMAIFNMIKYRKRGSPILSATKAVNLTAALVSMLSLETALLSQFGSDQPQFRRVMTAISGGAVCVIVLAMAVYMMVWSTKQLKRKLEIGEGGSHNE